MSSQPASSLARIVLLTAVSLGVGACAGTATYDVPPPEPVNERQPAREAPLNAGERAAVIAVRQVGVPYRYGGDGRDGFDCSGLVQFAYARAGVSVPRTTAALWKALRPVGKRELEVGDVLFFNVAGKMSHVGMYVGRRRFVHAPSSGREVTIADLDSDYYRRAFLRGGRPE